MGNLIATAIAIALVAVTTMIAAYYGGGVFRGYLSDASASRLMAEQEQILSAITMFEDDSGKTLQDSCTANGLLLELDCLVNEEYLSDLPGAPAQVWNILNNELRTIIGNDTKAENTCQSTRSRLGFDGPILPCCVESGNPSNPMACTSRTAAANPAMDPRDPCCTEP
ncbi:MAG TPA: hypothetical protein DCW68_00895 [Rhodospirillaceae bacterium]|nr:MAG: hypothetical protein A2018_00715 [Alphaproteobacteria bacterium GWF2_58_20]HAU28657.1 hypothetical protein [Rhodospirillaceae bacterium]